MGGTVLTSLRNVALCYLQVQEDKSVSPYIILGGLKIPLGLTVSVF